LYLNTSRKRLAIKCTQLITTVFGYLYENILPFQNLNLSKNIFHVERGVRTFLLTLFYVSDRPQLLRNVATNLWTFKMSLCVNKFSVSQCNSTRE